MAGWDFCRLCHIFQMLTETCIALPQLSSHGATCAFRDLIGKHIVKLSGNMLSYSLLQAVLSASSCTVTFPSSH